MLHARVGIRPMRQRAGATPHVPGESGWRGKLDGHTITDQVGSRLCAVPFSPHHISTSRAGCGDSSYAEELVLRKLIPNACDFT